MALLDNIKKTAADAVKEKTGLDLKNFDFSDIDEDTVKKIKDLAGKLDIKDIAKKLGVSEDIVKKVVNKLNLK